MDILHAESLLNETVKHVYEGTSAAPELIIHFGIIEETAKFVSESKGSIAGELAPTVHLLECADLGNKEPKIKNMFKAAGGTIENRIKAVLVSHCNASEGDAPEALLLVTVETEKTPENIPRYTNTVSVNETVTSREKTGTDAREATDVVKIKLHGPTVPHFGFGSGGYRTLTDLPHPIRKVCEHNHYIRSTESLGETNNSTFEHATNCVT